MPLRSEIFDDIYFSPEDGIAETQHVFLTGNDLPRAWQDKDRFTIAETGFGTGLNFLCAWRLFEQTAKPGQVLDYISFEKHPLSKDQIKDVLAPWADRFEGRLSRLVSEYPLRVPGFHRIVFNDQLRLTLIFDDVNSAIDQLVVPAGIDCWFLDGFAPAKNPEMWSEKLFASMAELSAQKARFATFTAAGFVRRGLEAAGFAVEKTKGFGRKRDMLKGRFVLKGKGGDSILTSTSGFEATGAGKQKKVAIIGGGLAGTSCAYVLKQQGFSPVVYEASECLASGASGNPVGLYNPRFFAYRMAEADFYSAAFAQTVRTLKHFDAKVDFHQCGALHLLTDETRRKKLKSAYEHGGWHEDHMSLLDAAATSECAGISLSYDALYLPDAGYVCPEKLCQHYADDIELRLSTRLQDIKALDADIVILACGSAIKTFSGLESLPVETVRGQLSFMKPSAISQSLKTNLCYGGYMSPVVEGRHVVGATFQKWLDHCDLLAEDHDLNRRNLEKAVPHFQDGLEIEGGRASLRTASKDRFPVIGPVVADGSVYASTAHGSHGILSSLMAAHIIADMVQGRPYSLPRCILDKLAPDRFAKRQGKKHQRYSQEINE